MQYERQDESILISDWDINAFAHTRARSCTREKGGERKRESGRGGRDGGKRDGEGDGEREGNMGGVKRRSKNGDTERVAAMAEHWTEVLVETNNFKLVERS